MRDDNRGERDMLDCLKDRPAGDWVYREVRVTPAFRDRMQGMEKRQPEFVVVAPQIGVLIIEVKDWNLTRNTYEWLDQHEIRVTERDTGQVTRIDNPAWQAETYMYALREIIKPLAFVTAVVAFPRVSRADFWNRLVNASAARNPQSRFCLDPERTLFKEDLDSSLLCPERLLERIARSQPNFRESSQQQIDDINSRLLPPSFRIGDYVERQENQRRLKRLTEKQQRWAFNLDPRKNYLLDVPGSGKTNVLISKALHLVDLAGEGAAPTILLTTYSRNLETNIKRILAAKIAVSPNRERYRDAITIRCVPALLEDIVATVLGTENLAAYFAPIQSPEDYERRLRSEVEGILRAEPDRFRRFDYVLVDEVQDFDNFYLQVVAHLCRGRNFFFVGDIGQKIYERRHDLERLGFVSEKAAVEKSYKMYRTPRHIAELANRFLLRDRLACEEFREHGYTEEFQAANSSKTLAQVLHTRHPEQEIANWVRDFLATHPSEEDIMIITSTSQLPRVEHELQVRGIAYEIGEPKSGRAVSLVDFMSAKGLERDIVLVSGIEDLYERSKPEAMFDDEDTCRNRELLSRRKVYVALTRTLNQLIVYYENPNNRFVSDLLAINNDILTRKQPRHAL